MRILPKVSRVVIETQPRGVLAAVAHDLRIDAPITSGETTDDAHCTARFDVASMHVTASRRHGSAAWHDPTEKDARDIEGRIRDEAFEGLDEIVVAAALDGSRASIETRAARSQTVSVPVRVERDGTRTKVTGECDLSLEALGTGKIHVPLGAIKLDDRVHVTFEIVLAE
ncbi:MAG TPA: hypothetical protein VGH28_18125 [Polyangiaceae bacterium]|jgi:hypothetical protein